VRLGDKWITDWQAHENVACKSSGQSQVVCKSQLHDIDMPISACNWKAVTVDLSPLSTENGGNNIRDRLQSSGPVLRLANKCDQQALTASIPVTQNPGTQRFVGLLLRHTTDTETVGCREWAPRPLVLHYRYDVSNAYHAHEDFVNFAMFVFVMGLQPGGFDLAMLDEKPQGPFMAMWTTLFKPPRFFSSLAESKNNVHDTGLCFHDVYYSPHSERSLLGGDSGIGRPTQCDWAPTLLRFRGLVLDAFRADMPQGTACNDLLSRAQDAIEPGLPKPDEDGFRVVVVSRRQYDGVGHQIGRTFHNENEVVAALRGGLRMAGGATRPVHVTCIL